MFENIANFFKKLVKTEKKDTPSKDTAKERLHLVLMQDRANVSADFMELMKQEIIEVIKKYIDVEESAIDVRLTNEIGEDGTKGAPALYANIPIKNIKNGIAGEVKNDNNDSIQENKKEINGDKTDTQIEQKEEPKKEQESNNKEEIENEKEENIQETPQEEQKKITEEKEEPKEEVESNN